MSVTLRDFQPINTWKPLANGPKWSHSGGKPMYVEDKSTGKCYFNESKAVVAIKGALLALGTPIVHTVAAVVNIAIRLFNILSGAHFQNKQLNFSAKMGNLGKDLLRVVLSPLTIVGLELAAVYTIVNPFDGRKLYASIERATYGSFVLAPCFQPEPNKHFFGGNIDEQNAF